MNFRGACRQISFYLCKEPGELLRPVSTLWFKLVCGTSWTKKWFWFSLTKKTEHTSQNVKPFLSIHHITQVCKITISKCEMGRQSATVTFWFTFSKAPKTPLYASCSVPKDRKHHEEVDTKNRAKSLKDDLFLLLFDGNEISYRYSVSVLWNAVLVFFSRIQLCLLPSVQRSRSWSTGFYF